MKRVFWLLPLAASFVLMACYMLDDVHDVVVSPRAPDTLLVENRARVSTLRGFACTVSRPGEDTQFSLYITCDIGAGSSTAIKLKDFTLQDGDTVSISKADLSWSM